MSSTCYLLLGMLPIETRLRTAHRVSPETSAIFHSSVYSDSDVMIFYYFFFYFFYIHPIPHLGNPPPPHHSVCLISVFLYFWLKMVRCWLKGRSCYGNEAGNKSWTHGSRGGEREERRREKRDMCLNKHKNAERRRGRGREKVSEVWINKNTCRGRRARDSEVTKWWLHLQQ